MKNNKKPIVKKPATGNRQPATAQAELELITYYVDGKRKTIMAKKLTTPWQKAKGMLFQKNPKPLFFTNNTLNYNPITSLFCKPFKAIWLDKNFHATKVIDVKTWKININGYGKYLLEIPITK